MERACIGKRIQQHVIVLGMGSSPSQIDEPPDLTFRFTTHYARSISPSAVLDDPLTAPWALLADAKDEGERERRFLQVMEAVASAGAEALAQDLRRTALVFATIAMSRETIERALREAGMPADMIRDTSYAQELFDEGRAEGLQASRQGLARILQRRGIAEARADLIVTALLDQDAVGAGERAAFADISELDALAAEG